MEHKEENPFVEGGEVSLGRVSLPGYHPSTGSGGLVSCVPTHVLGLVVPLRDPRNEDDTLSLKTTYLLTIPDIRRSRSRLLSRTGLYFDSSPLIFSLHLPVSPEYHRRLRT